jgi:PTS system galactitol-specific IIB component
MKKKILVACGTGVATSTVVAKKLEEKLRAKGIDVQIDQGKASDVGAKALGYDLVIATTQVDDTRGKPFLRTVSFLTGIGVDKDLETITKLLG